MLNVKNKYKDNTINVALHLKNDLFLSKYFVVQASPQYLKLSFCVYSLTFLNQDA